jgi:hypothetical protein
MIDGGVVVGYLTVALARGATRLADRAFDGLLDKLVGEIKRRLGSEPEETLMHHPADPVSRQQIARDLQVAMRMDPSFARELEEVVAELDRLGGRNVINNVNAQLNVQAIGGGIAVGGDVTYVDVPDPSDLSGAPVWVKATIALGLLLAVAGLGIFGYTLFTDMPDLDDPNFGETPEGIPLAAGVFFAGFVLLGIASIGRAFSRRR